MKRLFWAVIAIFMLFCASASAELRPARARLLLHGEHELDGTFKLQSDFIPSGDLLANGLKPVGYVMLAIQPAKWFVVTPGLGYAFRPNELILDMRLEANVGPTYFWGLIDAQPASWDAYWFAQLDYKVVKWFHAGLEEESWGNYKNAKYSHGAGPNLILRFGQCGFDLALHRRYYDDDKVFGTEFFGRFHVFLPDPK